MARNSQTIAFAHVPRDERGKFDSKTRKCILVGYSLQSKAYHLYDPQRRKLIVSRDVKFNEEEKESTPQVPETETQTSKDRYVIIETGDPNPIIDPETPAQPEEQPSQQPPPRRSARERSKPWRKRRTLYLRMMSMTLLNCLHSTKL